MPAGQCEVRYVRRQAMFTEENASCRSKIILLGVLWIILLGSVECRAEVLCPWLNAATAAGVLGGEVQLSVSGVTPLGDATCDFVLKQSASTSLHITVHTMSQIAADYAAFVAQCGGTFVPLRGIGNEAGQCVPDRNRTQEGERIVGRVRDRAFLIAVRRSPPASPVASKQGLSDETRNLAEQIAGALF
jgi:hypothetical protein